MKEKFKVKILDISSEMCFTDFINNVSACDCLPSAEN